MSCVIGASVKGGGAENWPQVARKRRQRQIMAIVDRHGLPLSVSASGSS
jgi:hypothetical protein